MTFSPAPSESGPFVDTVEHSLDSKHRITLPQAARGPLAAGGLLVLWKGPCVAIFTPIGFDRWVDYLQGELPESGYENPGGHVRFAHSLASRFKPDAQGRFQLGDRLRYAAGIEREVTIVGVGSRFELWNPANYGLDSPEYRNNIEHFQDGYDLVRDGAR